MSPAKTPAQRQAERKAREEAAGNRLYKRWVHPEDFVALDELVAKLARKREREAQHVGCGTPTVTDARESPCCTE